MEAQVISLAFSPRLIYALLDTLRLNDCATYKQEQQLVDRKTLLAQYKSKSGDSERGGGGGDDGSGGGAHQLPLYTLHRSLYINMYPTGF